MAARLCQLQRFGLMLPSPAVESIQVDSCIEMSRGSYLGLKSRKSPSFEPHSNEAIRRNYRSRKNSADEVDQPFIDGNNLDESYRRFGDLGFENWSLNPTVDLQQPCQEVLPLNVCSTHALELYSSRPFVGEFAAGTESDGGHNSIELLDKDRSLQMLEDCMMVEANDVSLRDYEPSLLAGVQSMEYLLDKLKYSVSQQGEI